MFSLEYHKTLAGAALRLFLTYGRGMLWDGPEVVYHNERSIRSMGLDLETESQMLEDIALYDPYTTFLVCYDIGGDEWGVERLPINPELKEATC